MCVICVYDDVIMLLFINCISISHYQHMHVIKCENRKMFCCFSHESVGIRANGIFQCDLRGVGDLQSDFINTDARAEITLNEQQQRVQGRARERPNFMYL